MAMIQQRSVVTASPPGAVTSLASRLLATRALSRRLADPLTPEDMTVQVMDDASPTKWHLAHVTWFFETFVLVPNVQGYRCFDAAFAYCFNSYYESQGPRQPRPKRGVLTRPSCAAVLEYRAHVDAALARLVESSAAAPGSEIARLLEVGIQHEQQHQELLLTDILALFAANPLRPAYRAPRPRRAVAAPDPLGYVEFPGGIYTIGHRGDGFAFDNEGPAHTVLLHPFRLADRLVTNAEWLQFMEDGGYRRASLWLADGWHMVQREAWEAPLYWERHGGTWLSMSLEGLLAIEPAAPVTHVSYYEADAYARWAGKRLPSEFEWEAAAQRAPVAGNGLGAQALRPLPAPPARGGLRQMFGDTWEWTQSAYLPYPGYRAPADALGEYNGKFMVSQHVLRGSSCATPDGHSRASYRNFFYPHQRWQFTGVRLASEAA
jgi:ergothioneine biosynthesis protein EgtB